MQLDKTYTRHEYTFAIYSAWQAKLTCKRRRSERWGCGAVELDLQFSINDDS